MKTASEKLENCQVELNVELEQPEFERHMSMALDRIAKNISLPGFRKGKAPLELVEQQVGREAILKEALEYMIPEAYQEALKSESINAIGAPDIELLQIDPIKFKAIVPVVPNVIPGDYRSIRLKLEKKEIGEDDIEQVISQLRLQLGTLIPVDKAIEYGDTAVIDVRGESDRQMVINREDAVYEVKQDSKYPVPGFSEQLLGLTGGQEKSFTIDFSGDCEIKELAGKKFDFYVKIREVRKMNLPEINDEFAKMAGSESLNELRSKIREELQTKLNDGLKRDFENKLINSIIDISTVEFPPILVEEEIDQIINDEARNFKDGVKGLENYLAVAKKTIEQHREELRPIATSRVKAYLVTSKIGELENISASDDEVNQQIEKMAKGYDGREEQIRDLFNMSKPRESLKAMIIINKTMDLLFKIATGEEAK
jgi:trigger factor